jgi:hypothetical protein
MVGRQRPACRTASSSYTTGGLPGGGPFFYFFFLMPVILRSYQVAATIPAVILIYSIPSASLSSIHSAFILNVTLLETFNGQDLFATACLPKK